MHATPSDAVVSEVTTDSQLHSLSREWSCLWGRCRSVTPFQAPEWLLPWWTCFGNGDLWLLTVRLGATLIGIAPFFVMHRSALRVLTMMGTGLSDYAGVLIDDLQPSRVVLDAIFAYICQHRARWTVGIFGNLPPESPLLSSAMWPGLHMKTNGIMPCPFLQLPASSAHLLKALRPKFRHNLIRCKNNLIKEYGRGASFERATDHTLPEYLEALQRLHKRRWPPGINQQAFDDNQVWLFHQNVARSFQTLGWLRFYGLRIGGTLIALAYCFVRGDRLFFYLTSFDKKLARFSPGTLLIWFAIEEAIREGLREYDFMRGTESYKYNWCAHNRINQQLQIW